MHFLFRLLAAAATILASTLSVTGSAAAEGPQDSRSTYEQQARDAGLSAAQTNAL